ncbi:uncharacterized protein LOC124316548 isoform X1 [Daphnia pulicaria]|uniref:uncharacterized protein LOC124316548 isoform X1 n=2 Tax=Daphnia pulicaria TaxID=35523 RepID=UPI001EE9DE43|nr:uncharacterized protein LOC124316548 isoform X1 [Daphnia pulicaria]
MAPNKGETKSLLSNKVVEPTRSCCCSRKMAILCVSLFGVALSAISLSFFAVSSYPLHASCRVDWTFGKPCDVVQTALVNQMQKWNMDTQNLCGSGQKCLYEFLTSSPTKVTGTHTTPVKRYVDDVSYTFTPAADNSCSVQGFSTSQTWYAVLDYGTNYCNIKNLVDGSNLGVNDSKYSENTRDAVCTQYSSANCEVY